MSQLSLFLTALSLSLDAFAVAMAAGASHKKIRLHAALKMALIIAAFHMAMPIAGWVTGQGLKSLITQADHWVAFVLLCVLGGKMIYEAVKPKSGKGSRIDILQNRILFALGLATSADAMVTGLSFSFLKVSLYDAVPLMGMTAFAMCVIGVWLGMKTGRLIKFKFEIFGGAVLMGLGFKILIGHLFF